MSSKLCPECKVEKSLDLFYVITRNGIKQPSFYCVECSKLQATDRAYLLKLKCVEYKGGKCCRCGYNRCLRSLDFHHVDPTKKEFSISHYLKFKTNVLTPELCTELEKTILVCKNCHGEIHDGVTDGADGVPGGSRTHNLRVRTASRSSITLLRLAKKQKEKLEISLKKQEQAQLTESREAYVKNNIEHSLERGWVTNTAKKLGISHSQVWRLRKKWLRELDLNQQVPRALD